MENITSSINKTHQIVAWTLLAGLLLLRLPFLAGIAMFSEPEWLDPAFQIGTYLLTAGLIWLERDRLADFHIDKLALGIIIIFKPIQTLLLALMISNNRPLAFPNPAQPGALDHFTGPFPGAMVKSCTHSEGVEIKLEMVRGGQPGGFYFNPHYGLSNLARAC